MFFERYKHTFLPLIRHHISDVIFPTSYFRHHISDVIFPTSYFHFLTRYVIMSLLFFLFSTYVIFPTCSIVLSFCHSVVLFYLMYSSYIIFLTRSIVLSFYCSVVLFYLLCLFLHHISDSFYRFVILSFCHSFLLNMPFLRHISDSLSIVLSVIFPTRSLLFCCSVVLFPTVPVSCLTLLTCFFFRCYCVI